ncbi:MAG TPA: hypothetical protein VL201_01595 [Patescibacteria group bacterium]|jgi:hypothetical protein|nr:hypothetical protein [Patescibacteria group bacterium]
MLYKKILLLLLNASLCLASEKTEPKVLLTKEELINLVKKIEEDRLLAERLLPAPYYISSKIDIKKFSETIPEEWFEVILDCANNHYYEYCNVHITLMHHWRKNEDEAYWARWKIENEILKWMENEEDYKEQLANNKKNFEDNQYKNISSTSSRFFAFIQGYVLAKKAICKK